MAEPTNENQQQTNNILLRIDETNKEFAMPQQQIAISNRELVAQNHETAKRDQERSLRKKKHKKENKEVSGRQCWTILGGHEKNRKGFLLRLQIEKVQR